MSRKRSTACLGSSLVEVVVSTLLVGLVLVTALDGVGSAVRTTRALSDQLDGHAYAAELMAEILSKPYTDPEEGDANATFGIESDEPSPATNRLALDDIDDFNGWTEGSALATREGAARMDTAGWGRAVEVVKLNHNNATSVIGDSASDKGVRRITVTVTSPTGQVTTLQTIRAAAGAMEQQPAGDTTYVTGVEIQLQTTNQSVTATGSLLNHATAP